MASQSLAARLPVAVMLIAVGIAVFSGTTRIALSTLQLQQSWQEVGADYRIENLRRGAPLPLELIDEGLGIEPATAAGLESRDLIITSPSGSAIADLLAVDSAYTEVLAESGLPERTLSLVDNLRMGTEQPTDNLIPVLISNDWTLNPKPKVGDTFSTNLALSGPDFVIEGIIDGLTGMDPDRPFIVVDLQALADAFGERATKPTFLLVQGLESTSGTINSALGPAADEVIVTSRHDVLNAIAGDPFSIWTRRMLRIVLALAATFAAVAAASTVAVSAATRARDVALLRTIGLRRSEANLLTVLEQLPALVVATTVGIIAGTGIAWLLEPALSLEDFASDRSQEISRVDITSLLGIALLMLVLMTGAAFAGVIAERRSDSAKILRAGDQ